MESCSRPRKWMLPKKRRKRVRGEANVKSTSFREVPVERRCLLGPFNGTAKPRKKASGLQKTHLGMHFDLRADEFALWMILN